MAYLIGSSYFSYLALTLNSVFLIAEGLRKIFTVGRKSSRGEYRAGRDPRRGGSKTTAEKEGKNSVDVLSCGVSGKERDKLGRGRRRSSDAAKVSTRGVEGGFLRVSHTC